MSEIIVSVICTAYNHEKYIKKCLEGFVAQKTNFPFEVIVHDDASTDSTASIIHEYELKYPDLIKPIYQTENQYSKGISITRNIVFPQCKGKYIAICEGDDFWIDDYKLQKQIDALETHIDCAMSVCKVMRVSEDESKIEAYYPGFPLDEGIINSQVFIDIILKAYAFQTSSYVFRSSLYKEYVDHTPEFAKVCPVGDEAYLLYFGNAGDVYYCKDCMSCYRRGSIGGFNERILSNRARRANHFTGMAKTHKCFDEYTKGKYHDLCSKRIYLENYYAAETSKDFWGLLLADESLFFKQTLRMQARVLIGALCNPLLKLYYKVIQKK